MSQVYWNALFNAPNPGTAFNDAFSAARDRKMKEQILLEDQRWKRNERGRQMGEWQREDDFRGATTDMLLGGGQPSPQGGMTPPQMNALASSPTNVPAFGGSNAAPQTGAVDPLAPLPAPTGTVANPAQPTPDLNSARERAIRANPEGFLTFQGKRLEVDEKQLKNLRDLNDFGMQILGGVHDQATYDAAKQRAAQLYSSHGHDASEFLSGLPAEYSPEVIRSLQMQGMDTSKQLQAIVRENRLEWDIEDDQIDNRDLRRHRNRTIDVRVRGQDVTDRRGRRGQDISSRDRQRGQDMTDKRVRETGKGKGNRSDLIGQVYQRGGKRIQYSKSKGGYVDVATGEAVK